MKVKNVVPVIAVKNLGANQAFYTMVFDFEVVYQNDWYLHLRSGGDEKVEIGFVASNHPSQPEIFQPVFDGRGVFYSFEVEDVDAEYQRLKSMGVPIKLEPRDEPWGERHFAISDPNHIIINISKTDREHGKKVEFREHMMQREKGVHK
jgi:catechol 2,3-dioxygenase-like lactoylglutathione lyase family enzyme